MLSNMPFCLPGIRNLVADQAELLSYPCTYSKRGCRVTLRPSELAAHAQVCDFHFERVQCPGCSWVGMVKDLRVHAGKCCLVLVEARDRSTTVVSHGICLRQPSLQSLVYAGVPKQSKQKHARTRAQRSAQHSTARGGEGGEGLPNWRTKCMPPLGMADEAQNKADDTPEPDNREQKTWLTETPTLNGRRRWRWPLHSDTEDGKKLKRGEKESSRPEPAGPSKA